MGREKAQANGAAESAMLPEESVSKMMAVMSELKPSGRAQFVDHAGQVIPWCLFRI